MTKITEQAPSQHEIAAQAAHDFIESLAHAETLPALSASFGVEMPGNLDTKDRLLWLKEFSNQHLDFRGGKERQQVGAVELTPEQEAAIMAAATELGMQGETNATKDQYDIVTVLGGANQSNLLRMRHAKKQMDRLAEQGNPVPYLILLGSVRKLTEKERENTANYAPGATTEFDLLNGALEHEFEVSAHDERVIDMRRPGNPDAPDAWRVRSYTLPNGTEVLSVSAPQVEGKRRVNTADTYRFMNEVMGREMLEGKDVLNATTDLFRFQHPDAIKELGLTSGAVIETIGYGGVERPASSYAQEINSMFNQTLRLQEALDAQAMQRTVDR